MYYQCPNAETEINLGTVVYSWTTKINTFRGINGFYIIFILLLSLQYGSVKKKAKRFKWKLVKN